MSFLTVKDLKHTRKIWDQLSAKQQLVITRQISEIMLDLTHVFKTVSEKFTDAGIES